MAKYKVLVESFINNHLVQEGEVVEYDGTPGDNLELIEAPKAPKKGGKAVAEDEAEDLA